MKRKTKIITVSVVCVILLGIAFVFCFQKYWSAVQTNYENQSIAEIEYNYLGKDSSAYDDVIDSYDSDTQKAIAYEVVVKNISEQDFIDVVQNVKEDNIIWNNRFDTVVSSYTVKPGEETATVNYAVVDKKMEDEAIYESLKTIDSEITIKTKSRQYTILGGDWSKK